MALLQPVLLSGGTGTRLWPLSREAYPKQFLALQQGGPRPGPPRLACGGGAGQRPGPCRGQLQSRVLRQVGP